MKYQTGRWIAFILVLLALTGIASMAIKDNLSSSVRSIAGYEPWPEETLKVAERLAVQDGGRIKPIGTYASFTMLRLNGARSVDIVDGAGKKIKLKPLPWLLDCLFRPQLAAETPIFRVDNGVVLEAAGMKIEHLRDRYSFSDLEPYLDKLLQLAQSYEQISKQDPKSLKPVEQQTLTLAYNIRSFQALISYFSFARDGLEMMPLQEGQAARTTTMSSVMQTLPVIQQVMQKAQTDGQPIPPHIQSLLAQVSEGAGRARYGLNLFPPADKKNRDWISAGDRIMFFMEGTTREPDQCLRDIVAMEEVTRALEKGQPEFRAKLGAVVDDLVARATARGEYRSVPLEVDYFRVNWFIYALAYFLMAVVTMVPMWLFGRRRLGMISYWVTVASITAGFACLVIPIYKRCVIMQRPPVGNLYDTIIFIAAVVVGMSLIVEFFTRRRFALSLIPLFGAGLIILARRFEVSEAKDHLDPLVAVLDSNYWLTIHVITITIGYACGLLTTLISVVYIFMRGLGLDMGDKSIRRAVTRSAYGMVCATLFFSLVGTVLGGIWANYSWGRFWGWDPKENGALLIVLWNLAILHARVGGYLKEWGLHLATTFGAIVIGFSWWQVNFLGVGLHNYGFAADKVFIVYCFYACVLAIMGFGAVTWLIEAVNAQKSATPKPHEKAPV
jgi:ABC-type transport system involved in cytochrome c biogenesis permease subunit